MKKLFTLLLAVAASIGTISAESGTCGANLTWDLTDGVLTISGPGAMTDWSYPSQVPWYPYRANIKSVTISNSVTSIGNYAFGECHALTNVTISNSVTSIGNSVFYVCPALTAINVAIDNINYSSEEGVLFNKDKTLLIKYPMGKTRMEYTIPNSVTRIGNDVFYDCTSLTSVTIPNSVAGIEQYAFYGCTSLTSIEIPNSVTSIGRGVFRGCTSLTSIEIPNSITSIGNEVLYGCTSLISIEIPNSITSIGNEVLYGCTSLTSVTIPNSVTSIGDWAFYGCSSLTSIEIPQSVRSIGEHAFSGCSGLTAIEIPDQVTNIKYGAFAGCRGLTTIEIPSNVTSIGMMAFDDCRGLTSVTIPNSVTRIDYNAFLYCYSLTSVTVPNSVTIVNNGAFAGVTNVVYSGSVNGAPWGAKSKNGYVEGCLVYNDASKTILRGCSAVATGEIVIPNSVTTINERAFEGCEGITSVTIPNSVTSIGNYAFPNIANISYTGSAEGSPWGAKCVNGYVEGYLVYSDATKTNLLACSTAATGEIVIPNSVTTIGEQAFMYCGGITSVSLPNSVTSIGNEAFFGCSGLTSVSIPNSVTSIGSYAFGSCRNLTSVTIPYSVFEVGDGSVFGEGTQVTEIHFQGTIEEWCNATDGLGMKSYGYYLYINDVKIEKLIIPSNVTSIGNYAFYGCRGLTSITCEAITPPTLGSNVFSSVNTSIPLYVPAGSVSAYQSADQWKDFTNILPIEETPGTCITASGTCGDNLTWELSCDSVLTISGSGDIPGYSSSSQAPWYDNRDRVKNIIVGDNVTSIGQSAFGMCNNLDSISIGKSVTFIDNYVLYQLNNLRVITCYAENPPEVYGKSLSLNSAVILYVPGPSINAYRNAYRWKTYNTVLPVPGTEVACEPYIFPYDTIVCARDYDSWHYISWREHEYNIDVLGTYHYYDSLLTVDGCDSIYELILTVLPSYNYVTQDTISIVRGKPVIISKGLPWQRIEYPTETTVYGDTMFTVFGCDSMVSHYVIVTEPSFPVIFLNHNSEVLSEQYVEYNQAAQAPQVPAREGYTFSGWSTDIEHIVARTYAIALYDKIGGTLTYLSEEGDIIATENVDLHLPAAPIIAGKSFKGWLTESADSENGIVLRATYTFDNPTTHDDVTITPSSNSAAVIFPFITGALTYQLVIRDLFGNVVCKIMFSATGHLLGIAFAPSRNRESQQATQTTGFNFTVEGLDANTTYEYEFVANDDTDEVIETLSGSFTTTTEVPTDNEQVNSPSAVRKYLDDGHLMIDANSHTFDTQGKMIR